MEISFSMGRKKKVRQIATLLDLPPDLVRMRDERQNVPPRPPRVRQRYCKVRTAVRLDAPRPLQMGAMDASVLVGSQVSSVGELERAENNKVEASIPFETGDAQPPPQTSDQSDGFELYLDETSDLFINDDLGLW